MRTQLEMRLDRLRTEFETGQIEFEKVEQQRVYLRETLLRIGGAIQVLEEVLAADQPDRQNGAHPQKAEALASLSSE